MVYIYIFKHTWNTIILNNTVRSPIFLFYVNSFIENVKIY